MNPFDEAKSLITKVKSKEAIDLMMKVAKENNLEILENQFANLKMQVEEVETNALIGMISFSEATREKARVNHGILGLITKLEEEVEALKNKKSDEGNDSNNSGKEEKSNSNKNEEEIAEIEKKANQEALKILLKKKGFMEKEMAKESGASAKFDIMMEIEEVDKKIEDLKQKLGIGV